MIQRRGRTSYLRRCWSGVELFTVCSTILDLVAAAEIWTRDLQQTLKQVKCVCTAIKAVYPGVLILRGVCYIIIRLNIWYVSSDRPTSVPSPKQLNWGSTIAKFGSEIWIFCSPKIIFMATSHLCIFCTWIVI